MSTTPMGGSITPTGSKSQGTEQQITIGISSDGTSFVPAGSFTLPPGTEATQQIAITQPRSNPAGSYTDWDMVTVRSLADSTPAPIAHDDAFATDEDQALTQPPPGVLANDEELSATSTASLATSPSHGSLVLNADGSFTYTPVANYHGTDSFTYTTATGARVSAAATVTITVTDVTDGPTDPGGPVIFDEQFSSSPLAPPWTYVQPFDGRGRFPDRESRVLPVLWRGIADIRQVAMAPRFC